MLTKQRPSQRETWTIDRIQSMLAVRLGQYAAMIQVSIENTVIVLRGELPSIALKQQLVPAIRQAGVLGQVSDCVRISA